MRWRPPVPGQAIGPFSPEAHRPHWLGDPSLLAAFWRYERALMTNDVPELDELFAIGDETIRSEAGSALVGHDAIAAFRASRPPVPSRYLRRVHMRQITADAAVIVAESVRGDRGTGTQTQLWQRVDGLWAVTVAHVSTVPGMQFSALTLEPLEERAIWVTPAHRRPLIPSIAYQGGSDRMGTLAGVRVAVKDLFALAGETIGGGNPRFREGRTPETTTAPAVAALIREGAEITGIAQTDELAFSIAGTNLHYGTPPNPAAPGRTTGGSTSGPASAVALGLADLGLGTDTAGSIRVPGSYCGLYGLRTTHDAVSRQGLVGLAPSFDSVGLLARDLTTLAAGALALFSSVTPTARPSPSPGSTSTSTLTLTLTSTSTAKGAAAGSASASASASAADAIGAGTVTAADRAGTSAPMTEDVAPMTDGVAPVTADGDPAADTTVPLCDAQAPDASGASQSPYDFDGRAFATETANGEPEADRAATSGDEPITTIVVDPVLVALAEPANRLTFEASVRALALNSGADVLVNDGSTALDASTLEQWFDAFRIVQQFEAWIEDGDFVTANPGALDQAIAERFRAASAVTAQQAQDARAVLASARIALDDLLPPGTALALPSTSGAAPSLDASPGEIDVIRAATLRLTCLASLAGLPALTLPYGRTGTLPTGLCLVGGRGSDLALIALATPRTE